MSSEQKGQVPLFAGGNRGIGLELAGHGHPVTPGARRW